MNKKELTEIKKIYRIESCPLNHIYGCFVKEREIYSTYYNRFLALPEEEVFKYLHIFRKVLSGKIGKNENVISLTEQPGITDYLDVLNKKSDNSICEQFCQRVADRYSYAGNFLILIGFGAYDIPGVTKDNREMYDASEEVYIHMLCCICAVDLTKPGLIVKDGEIKTAQLDWMIGDPMVGFLYPAFTDRSADTDHMLYFEAKPNEKDRFLKDVFDLARGKSPEEQEETLQQVISECFENIDFETVKGIYEDIAERLVENEHRDEPLEFGKEELIEIFDPSSAESVEEISNICEYHLEDEKLTAINVGADKLKIKDYRIEVKVDMKVVDHVSLRKNEDGVNELVLQMNDEIEVNGVKVRRTRMNLEEGKR